MRIDEEATWLAERHVGTVSLERLKDSTPVKPTKVLFASKV